MKTLLTLAAAAAITLAASTVTAADKPTAGPPVSR